MAKGIFSQGVCVLTDGQTAIEDAKLALQEHDFEVVKEKPAQKERWFGGHTLIVPFRPEVNGYAAVDVVNEPWPDTMGDPKSDPMTFGAWSMGYFGPLAFPGGLARAGQHAWAWQAGRTIAGQNRGFIRIRLSYCFGAKDNFSILPKDYDPLAEMNFLSRVVMAELQAPGAICYFNPNGEVLRDHLSFSEVWTACVRQQMIPLPLWMNVRFFNLNEEFGLMDTVGNGQLDVQDVEAIFPHAEYDSRNIDYYLRNITHYLLDFDGEIKSGASFDGPGETELSWTAEVLKEGSVQPPRRVLRLYPKAKRKDIKAALTAIGRSPD